MKRNDIRNLTHAAVVGAIYVVLGYFGNTFNLTFGAVQCRFSEALTVLPFLSPATSWGLYVGCIATNLLSPYGPLDMIFGPITTFAAAWLTSRCRHKWLAPLPPVVLNALVIGGLIAFQETGLSAAFPAVFVYHALTIGAGQIMACYGLGMVLLGAMRRIKTFRTGR